MNERQANYEFAKSITVKFWNFSKQTTLLFEHYQRRKNVLGVWAYGEF